MQHNRWVNTSSQLDQQLLGVGFGVVEVRSVLEFMKEVAWVIGEESALIPKRGSLWSWGGRGELVAYSFNGSSERFGGLS